MVQMVEIGVEIDIEGMETGMMTEIMVGEDIMMMIGTNDIIKNIVREDTTIPTTIHGGIHTGINGLHLSLIQYLTGLVCHRLHCPHHTRIHRHTNSRCIIPHNTILK